MPPTRTPQQEAGRSGACVKALHAPVFVSAKGHAHTNGPTVFSSGDGIVACDKPLLEWVIAAALARR